MMMMECIVILHNLQQSRQHPEHKAWQHTEHKAHNKKPELQQTAITFIVITQGIAAYSESKCVRPISNIMYWL